MNNHKKYIDPLLGRRTFLKSSTMAAAGFATYISSVPAMGPVPAGEVPAMLQERFFPISAINDTINLLQLEGRLSDVLKNALNARPDLVRMGGLVSRRSGNLSGFTAELRSAGTAESKSTAHLAMILGAAMFSGVKTTLGTLYPNHKTDNKGDEVAVKAIYHDVAVLQGISEGSIGPLDLTSVTEKEMISLFEMMWHRSLIKLHTTKPDLSDTQAWILRFTDFVKNQDKVYKEYATAYLKKKPDQYEKYVVKPNIYNANDALITALRSPGKKLFGNTSENLKQALDQREGVSVYTKAILQAYRHAHQLNGFWEGKYQKNEIAAIFD